MNRYRILIPKLCHDNNSPLNLSRVSFESFAFESSRLGDTEETAVLFGWAETFLT